MCMVLFGIGIGTGTPVRAEDAMVTLKSGGRDFSPKKVQIRVGERVTWKNPTNEVHSVTSFATDSVSQSGGENPEINKLVRPGERYSHRFSVAGSYFYYCPIHQGMWGTVVVVE